jgi:hypothetical protein
VFSQDPTTEYPYDLPDPLIRENGSRVTQSSQWYGQRRPEILDLFATHIYGHTPGGLVASSYKDVEIDQNALGGSAIRKQIRVVLSNALGSVEMEVLLYLPKTGNKPHPVFLAMNFNGNHTVASDRAIRIPKGWVDKDDNKASASDRGMHDERWPLAAIIARGYGVATVYYGDIDPDYDDGFKNGVHPLFYSAGESRPAADQWGSIGAWAWGLSRTLDYLIDDSDVDNNRIAVMGFSRLAKSALWAAAQDQRFAMAISNNSGTLGASLSRREGIASGKEPLSTILSKYGYWFARNLAQYSNNPGLLPVDQHQLIALMAPRPVYIASAKEDLWADPRGEFEGGLYAGEVYKLLGKQGIATTKLPALNRPLTTTVGYHIRPGKHDVTDYDWQRFMDFADRNMTGN